MIVPREVPELGTARMRLRACEPSDAAALFAIYSDPEVMRYGSSLPMTTLAEAEAKLAQLGRFAAEGTGLCWGMCLREDGRFVGTCSLFRFDTQCERAEIGYMLARAYWGRGLMNEALTTIVAHAFGPMGVRRLEADLDPDNAASERALARLGFAREGLLRERWVVGGHVSDSLLMGLLRREWLARRAEAG